MVYKDDLIITDPDSGKEIKRIIGEKVGIITVWKIEADHLSIAEIVEGIGKIEKGDVVKPE